MSRTAVLLSAAATAIPFALVWIAVATRTSWVLRIDHTVTRDTHDAVLAHRSLLDAARVVTQFGNPIVVNAVVAVVTLWLLVVRRAVRPAVAVVVVRVLSLLAGAGVKNIVDRTRPSFADPVAYAGGYSFPSGHAYGSTAAALIVAYLALTARRHRRIAAPGTLVLAVLWILGVASSRVLLGVHWLSDVVGGVLLSTAIALAVLGLVSFVSPAVLTPGPRTDDPVAAR